MTSTVVKHPTMVVRGTADFGVTGDGSSRVWEKTEWLTLTRLRGSVDYATRAKMLYSAKGLYFLFDGVDARLTASMTEPYARIYEEDVVEVFLWPDPAQNLYFEYEVSPLGNELPLLVPNSGGKFKGWIPWEYEGERRIQKATHVRGGSKMTGSVIQGWSAEFFIPYALLEKGMGNIPPRPGMRWRGNFYRIDYDVKPATFWAWSPVKGSYHDYENFGWMVFE